MQRLPGRHLLTKPIPFQGTGIRIIFFQSSESLIHPFHLFDCIPAMIRNAVFSDSGLRHAIQHEIHHDRPYPALIVLLIRSRPDLHPGPFNQLVSLPGRLNRMFFQAPGTALKPEQNLLLRSQSMSLLFHLLTERIIPDQNKHRSMNSCKGIQQCLLLPSLHPEKHEIPGNILRYLFRHFRMINRFFMLKHMFQMQTLRTQNLFPSSPADHRRFIPGSEKCMYQQRADCPASINKCSHIVLYYSLAWHLYLRITCLTKHFCMPTLKFHF